MKNVFLPLFCIMLLLNFGCSTQEKDVVDVPRYAANFDSLAAYNEQPDWFQDAKLGIYFHWGVYSVPAFGNEWYPRNMHFKDSREYQHHVKTYGEPSEFGYHDFVPMFKAENFNADEWATLFKQAGARFAGPVAEHHDGYSMWASKLTPWNTMDNGPHRDILGELSKAIKARDMKLITTFHHERNLQRHDSISVDGHQIYNNSHYPFFAGMPPTSDVDSLKYLYGNLPEDMWLEKIWFGKLKEVIDTYQPDIIWFDSWLDIIPETYRAQFAAYYFNTADSLGKEVVVVRKQDDLPLDFSVNDLEKSRMNRIVEKSWMTDETISYGSWCYTQDLRIKPTKDIIHVLVDIVSKNGVLLLNISPMANGTIPQDQQKVLLEIGDWLQVNGEAIYGTRPWITFGEGPTKEPEGDFKNHRDFEKIVYTNKDMRYTTKGSDIYATFFGWPDGDSVLLTTFTPTVIEGDLQIKNISLLGYDGPIDWEKTDHGISIKLPEQKTNDMAVVFKLETEGNAKLMSFSRELKKKILEFVSNSLWENIF
ncbi:MAG: alpha-L-fucosidase [Cyclobacteriaceae bacterium]|nr:alpha-L-fucosidase [Cyclobacteriaceae bacterium]